MLQRQFRSTGQGDTDVQQPVYGVVVRLDVFGQVVHGVFFRAEFAAASAIQGIKLNMALDRLREIAAFQQADIAFCLPPAPAGQQRQRRAAARGLLQGNRDHGRVRTRNQKQSGQQ